MVAEPAGGGWLLTGDAPWVTGWERRVVYIGARHGDEVVWALVDATEAPTLTATPSDLAADASSSTVALHLDRHSVGPERVVDVEAFTDWTRRDTRDLRTNGYLAIGVAARAERPCSRCAPPPARSQPETHPTCPPLIREGGRPPPAVDPAADPRWPRRPPGWMDRRPG